MVRLPLNTSYGAVVAISSIYTNLITELTSLYPPLTLTLSLEGRGKGEGEGER